MSLGYILVMIGFSIGLQLGWHSDWFRRLFRMGPYKRPRKTTYRWKD